MRRKDNIGDSRRWTWTTRVFLLSYLLIVLWTVWPMLSWFFAVVVADHLGCALGGLSPCHLMVVDISQQTLNDMAFMPWVLYYTVPSGAGLLLVLGTVHLCTFGVSRYRKRRLRTPA
jgi:hypothetical protein